MSQARFQKREREKTRREKAAAKADRRTERKSSPNEQREATTPEQQNAILAELAELHARFEAEQISFEDFLAAKQALTEQLSVD